MPPDDGHRLISGTLFKIWFFPDISRTETEWINVVTVALQFIYLFFPLKKICTECTEQLLFFLIVEICFVQIIESYPLLIYIWLCLYHEAGEKARTSCKCFGVLSLAKTEIFCSNDEELR